MEQAGESKCLPLLLFGLGIVWWLTCKGFWCIMLSNNGKVGFVVSFGRPPVELGISPSMFYRYVPYGTTIVGRRTPRGTGFMSKRKMIEGLLEAYEYAITPEEYAKQFMIWLDRVASALAVAGMDEEHKAWCEAKELTYFYDDDATFPAQAESMKAILVGILDKLEEIEPSEELLPMEIVEGTRNYIEKLATQANGCYQKGWYDACAVIVRRLVEMLIIDCFEQRNIASEIKDANGDYYGLAELIGHFLRESSTWHIPRPVKKYLPKLTDLKEIGDTAAHGRHLVTRKQIEDLAKATAYAFQGLVEIAYFQS